MTRVVDGTIELVSAEKEEPNDDSDDKTTTNDRTNVDVPFWSLPGRKALVDLCKLAGPIFFVMMGKIACYSVMTVRATNFGIVPPSAQPLHPPPVEPHMMAHDDEFMAKIDDTLGPWQPDSESHFQ